MPTVQNSWVYIQYVFVVAYHEQWARLPVTGKPEIATTFKEKSETNAYIHTENKLNTAKSNKRTKEIKIDNND